MKNRIFVFFLTFLLLGCGTSCAGEDKLEIPESTAPATGAGYFGGKKVLIAYFSWGGTTRRMARQVHEIIGGDLFHIEPVKPYPTEYGPCTVVAQEEKNNNARPEIKDRVTNWNDYDIVFIGCPVWWWTTPMIIHTFCESYDFAGKTVVPFRTYAATYRDETLSEIVNSTPPASHLTGEGLTSGAITRQRIQTWIDLITEEWNNNNRQGSGSVIDRNTADISDIASTESIYDLNGRRVFPDTGQHGIFIVKNGSTANKILK